jgi:Putative restriction endonuclease
MALETITPTATDWTPSPEEIYRLNVEQYESMVSSGLFAKCDRIHLINGILVAKATKKPPRVIACEKTRDALQRIVPQGWRVMVEAPVRIPSYIEPEPDLGLARGRTEDYETRHPEPADLALVIEVAESSLRQDRELMQIYGNGGVPTAWIVNLIDRQVEVFTDPCPEGYRSRHAFDAGQEVPLVIEGAVLGRIAVGELLPQKA